MIMYDQFKCLSTPLETTSEKLKPARWLTAICFLLPTTRDITEGKPLPVEVTGIEYMNDDPAMVDVLYAKVSLKDKSDK